MMKKQLWFVALLLAVGCALGLLGTQVSAMTATGTVAGSYSLDGGETWEQIEYGCISLDGTTVDLAIRQVSGGFATNGRPDETTDWQTAFGGEGIYDPRPWQGWHLCFAGTPGEALDALFASDPGAEGNTLHRWEPDQALYTVNLPLVTNGTTP